MHQDLEIFKFRFNTDNGFLPAQVTVSDETGPVTQAAIAATLSQLDQNRNRRAGLGDPRGIDFGVTQQLLPTAPPLDQ